jgi:UDP-N-acetylmuramyl pentapeptide phosphotransferase/UDP-N-acetylglucosamine-1-phosphate transferase
MKYHFLISFAILMLAFSFAYKNKFIESLICLLITIVVLGFYDILKELKKNNKGILIRDPKTGRFKKQC